MPIGHRDTRVSNFLNFCFSRCKDFLHSFKFLIHSICSIFLLLLAVFIILICNIFICISLTNISNEMIIHRSDKITLGAILGRSRNCFGFFKRTRSILADRSIFRLLSRIVELSIRRILNRGRRRNWRVSRIFKGRFSSSQFRDF